MDHKEGEEELKEKSHWLSGQEISRYYSRSGWMCSADGGWMFADSELV